MTSNNRANSYIKWVVIGVDFLVLNFVIGMLNEFHSHFSLWSWGMKWSFVFGSNLALLLSEMRFSTIIHQRVISAGDIVRRVFGLVVCQTVLAYILMKLMGLHVPAGHLLMFVTPSYFVLLLLTRLAERHAVKLLRSQGRNSRTATFVGNDPELLNLYDRLVGDPTMGYRIRGYYADAEMGEWTYSQHSATKNMGKLPEEALTPQQVKDSMQLEHLGTLQDFMKQVEDDSQHAHLSDEVYVCLSRRDRDIIKQISRFCDKHVMRFYYLPVSVESIGINLKREMIDDMELFTTYEIPLDNPANKMMKRAFDVVASLIFLIPTALMFPFIWLIIKIQSPGPIFFKQKRTGLDGRDFEMLKFRSMHVNKDADKLQATKDDPRKYPFGDFMRKSNIDELPQFLNVLKGDMSFVGPRPHMLLHTEQYSKLIDTYMVRHFVKPGLTGWAQVTGFRGETKELWQMEGRVKRDIWYIEHWSIWLDIRIIWLTAKTIFIHDKNAY